MRCKFINFYGNKINHHHHLRRRRHHLHHHHLIIIYVTWLTHWPSSSRPYWAFSMMMTSLLEQVGWNISVLHTSIIRGAVAHTHAHAYNVLITTTESSSQLLLSCMHRSKKIVRFFSVPAETETTLTYLHQNRNRNRDGGLRHQLLL